MVVAKFASVGVWFPLLWRGARRAGWLSPDCFASSLRSCATEILLWRNAEQKIAVYSGISY